MEIAVLGSEAFVLGFQLTGIRLVKVTEKNPAHDFAELRNNPNVGIIITDRETIDQVEEHERYVIERSSKPILITMSDSGSDLRAMIKQAIGIDLE